MQGRYLANMLATPRRAARSASIQGRLWLCAAWLFVALLSGMPRLAAELYAEHFDCCGGCEDEDEQQHGTCPPGCDYGTCAKSISTTTLMMVEILAPAEVPQTFAALEHLGARSGIRVDVFHPPRA